MRKGNIVYGVYAPNFYGTMHLLDAYTTERKAKVRRKTSQRFYEGTVTIRQIILQ